MWRSSTVLKIKRRSKPNWYCRPRLSPNPKAPWSIMKAGSALFPVTRNRTGTRQLAMLNVCHGKILNGRHHDELTAACAGAFPDLALLPRLTRPGADYTRQRPAKSKTNRTGYQQAGEPLCTPTSRSVSPASLRDVETAVRFFPWKATWYKSLRLYCPSFGLQGGTPIRQSTKFRKKRAAIYVTENARRTIDLKHQARLALVQ